MKIECTVDELKELLMLKKTPVALTTDELPQHLFCNVPPSKS